MSFNVPLTVEPQCQAPDRLLGRQLKSLDSIDLACPPLMTPPSAAVQLNYGDNVTLSCRVTGDPEPRVAWWFAGHQIPLWPPLNDSNLMLQVQDDHDDEANLPRLFYTTDGGTEDKTSQLFIPYATERENGTFYCTAENRAGSARANFSVYVEPLPTAAPPETNVNLEYVVTVGGVVAAIVVTLIVIVVAVAVRCCCCGGSGRRRRHGRRTQDKSSNHHAAPAAAQDSKDGNLGNGVDHHHQQHQQQQSSVLPQPHVQINRNHVMLQQPQQQHQQYQVNGHVAYGMADGVGIDQMSPDLISDAQWKAAVQGYPLYDVIRMHTPSGGYNYYQQQQQNPNQTALVQTISQAVTSQDATAHFGYMGAPPATPAGHYLDADGFPVDYGLPRPLAAAGGRPQVVRFAEPPSTSVRHYENYVVDEFDGRMRPVLQYNGNDDDGDDDGQQQQHHHYLMADSKYPDMCGHFEPMTAPPNGDISNQLRYPSERYPVDYVAGGEGHYGQQQQQHQQLQQQPQNLRGPLHVMPSPPDEYKNHADRALVAPLSPLEVSIAASPPAAARQPHESPDEGYEDEGVDGTEI